MSLYQKAEEPGGSPFSSEAPAAWTMAAGDALTMEKERKRKRKERRGAGRGMAGVGGRERESG